jgi:phosphoribosylglycinamide formyltransferase 2
MSDVALKAAEYIAEQVVNALGGYGLFGVELFIKGDKVIFNEVSPRPHDTGLVTLISQDMSEFALHVRAFTGMPVNKISQRGPSASAVILGEGKSDNIRFEGLEEALAKPDTQARLFGKPDIDGRRRLGVVLAKRKNTQDAVDDAKDSAKKVKVIY